MVTRRLVRSVALVGTILVLGACGSSSKSSTATTVAPSATSATSAPSSSSAGTSVAGATTLAVADNGKLGEPILVGPGGRTVYLYQPDGTGTASKVPDAIKGNWPPVTASGAPTAGAGVEKAKIAVQNQPDGTAQVAYNGHLLYTYVGDGSPGTANGQGLGGVWFALSPAGSRIG